MIRYAVNVDGKWHAIGTQFNEDVQYAHLYTTEKLADKCADSYRSQTNHLGIPRYTDVKVVSFHITPIQVKERLTFWQQ